MLIERLKLLRKKFKITQRELAEKLLVSQQTVAKWETDGASPNPDMLIRIAEIFNVSVDYLLGNTNNSAPPNENSPGKEPELSIDTLEYALYGEARELDDDEKRQLLELAKLMRKKRREAQEK